MTYAFVGDGCLQEGVGQEVISLAGHLRLGHLVFVWDNNKITDDGATSLSISEDVAERFRVAGWHVAEVDGHGIEAVSDALAAARMDDRPSLIACRTTIAKGIRRLEGQRGGHSGKLFGTDRDEMAVSLGWPTTPFTIPNDVAAAWLDAGVRSRNEYDAWKRRVAMLDDATGASFERTIESRLPEGWRDVTSTYKAQAIAEKKRAYSIETSGEVASALYDLIPEIMTCCADLEAPTNHKRQLEAFTATNPQGRYVHCGVREHAMGALANGIAAHGGVIPLAVTYLSFADYERPAMRMAALMGLPVKFIFSHDSIGIGKNGPTHQPVEILASLRAVPNMLVLRPADAAEMADCWEIMLEHTTGPVSLVCARQQLDQLRCDASMENRSRRGAYVLAEADGKRRVTLLATGSEVALAMDARAILQAKSIPTAVVSMPCWELFELQDEGYRSLVLGASTARVGVEAAMKFGWERWLGHDGAFVGMTGFGASGPADALYRHFNITADAIVAAALAIL
jgi:transketolase